MFRDNPEILSVMAELSEVIEPAAAAAAPEGTFVSYPGSPFQLFQPYPPAGDQPAAIAQLIEGPCLSIAVIHAPQGIPLIKKGKP